MESVGQPRIRCGVNQCSERLLGVFPLLEINLSQSQFVHRVDPRLALGLVGQERVQVINRALRIAALPPTCASSDASAFGEFVFRPNRQSTG